MLHVYFSPATARLLVVVFALLLLLATPLFFIGGPDWVSSQLLRDAWNFGHVLFYALLLIVVQWFLPLPRWRHWLSVSLVALSLGAVIEVVQHFVGRHASWSDIFNNLAGVWLGLFWGQHPASDAERRQVRSGRVLSLLLIAPALWLVVESMWAELALRRAFPVVNSFETRAEQQQLFFNAARVDAQFQRENVSQGSYSLRLELAPGGYSGVRLRSCYGDWSAYEFLFLDAFNPGLEPLRLVLRLSDVIHDRGTHSYHDRYNQTLVLQPGWNKLQFPIADISSSPQERAMQMGAICNLGIFAAGLAQPAVVYLDNIRLGNVRFENTASGK